MPETSKQVLVHEVNYTCDFCQVGILNNPVTEHLHITYKCNHCGQSTELSELYPKIVYSDL